MIHQTLFVGALLAAPNNCSVEWVWQGAQQAAPLQENTFERSTLIGEIVRTEDGYIIRKCLDGDPAAFGLLVDKYRSSIYALAYSKLGNFHDAQDIAQEAFIKAYRKLHTLRQYDNFLAWLYAITSNLCKNWIRAKYRRPDREFVEDQDPKSLDRTSISSYQEDLARESIREALDSLPEIYREVLTLYYLGGMSVKEIAKFLGISPNTIVQRLNRGRLKLREETLIMMTATFNQYKLQPAFTFRIVEMVKRIGVLPRAPWLPWGLSLVTGTILTILGFITSPILFNPNVDLSSSEVLIEAKVLDVGEVPVDVLKISDVPIMFDGRGGSRTAPTLRDALAFLFAPQGGEGKWTKKADMPTARYELSTGVVNGKIYAIGGENGGSRNLSTVEEYSPTTNTWTKKADMPTGRRFSSSSVVNGKIYAIGGISFNRLVLTVEEYDPKTDTWTKKADMPTGIWGLSTSAVNGKIYAIGGANAANRPLSTVEEYDPKTDTWTKKADMPTARAILSTSVVNGKIYAIGGEGGKDVIRPLSTVEEYDPATNKWTKKADMLTARTGLSTSVVSGKIYAIGGSDKGGVDHSTVEEYDPKTDTWTKKAADMPTTRYALSTSAVNGKIYAIGGFVRGGVGALSTVEEFDLGFAGEAEEGQGVEAKGKHVTSWGKMKK